MAETGPGSPPPKNVPAESIPPKPPRNNDSGGNKTPPAAIEDDDYEDGDMATPKRDRYGTDDEPL